MEDQIAASSLAVKAWQKLKEVSPTHELVLIMESDDVSDDVFTNRFWDKKENWKTLPGSMVSMRVETNYFLAVKKVLKEEHGIDI